MDEDSARRGTAEAGPRLAHQPALDGLRGLAVAGVLLFHGGYLSGGFLGVDAFFVLSGFLITSLLLAEAHATGTVALGAFWARRARRLLPALACVLAAVALYAAVLAEAGRVGNDPRRCPRDDRLLRELAGDLHQPRLLGPLPEPLPTRPHVESRDRGAVLRRVAPRRGRAGAREARCGRGETRARRRDRARAGVGRLDGGDLRSGRHVTCVLRDGHARRLHSGRRGVGRGARLPRPGPVPTRRASHWRAWRSRAARSSHSHGCARRARPTSCTEAACSCARSRPRS